MQANSAVGRAAAVSVLVSTFTIIPIQFYVVYRILSEIQFYSRRASPDQHADRASDNRASDNGKGSVDWPLEPDSKGSSPCVSLDSLVGRLLLLAAAGLLAASIPNFPFVIALIGSFTTMLISFIAPPLLYVGAHGRSLGWRSLSLNALLVLTGVAGMVAGVRNAFLSLE